MPEMLVTPLDEHHLEAAADWFLLLAEDPSPAARQRWRQWHDEDAAHQQAWLKVEKLQTLLAAAPRQTRRTLDKAGRKSRRQAMSVLSAVLTAGVIYALLPARHQAPRIEWIATARGERRELTLPDGGRVWLGSGTRIGIAYGTDSRDIHLSQGALQLSSGHDALGRPLRIIARDGVMRPLGTRLTASVYAAHTVLAVQEHAVELQPLNGVVLRVDAGQRVDFDAHGAGRPERAPLSEDAWTRGLIMAMNMPLPAFAEQFALYSGQPVGVAPGLAGRRVSGTFQIDAPERSLQTLAEVLSVRLDKTIDGWELRSR